MQAVGRQVAEFADGAETVMLLKPETFMNLSGSSVRQAVDFYKLPADGLLVVCDDIALPLGKLRVRAQGTHGGHNGLRDIQAHLGTTTYARLRVGVGLNERRVPIRGYDALEPYIDRVRQGDLGALFGRGTKVLMFAMTSGTTKAPELSPGLSL